MPLKYTYTTFISSLILASIPAFAKTEPVKVPGFVPGNYVLESSSGGNAETKNSAELCGEGEFKIVENGHNILLGPKHGFFLKTDSDRTIATDNPEERGCVYENTNTFAPGDDSTVLGSKETLSCDGEIRHKFTETATVSKEHVHYEFRQTGGAGAKADNNMDLDCTWKLGKRGTASIKKADKKK